MSGSAARVVETLAQRTLTLATAESLTGGLIGATITTVPGASKVYIGGVVAYDTRLKHELLDVPTDVIDRWTVVSEHVALAMAIGLQERTNADWVVAVTGVAGPTPQDGHEPGDVWICVRGPRVPHHAPFELVEHYAFSGDRAEVRDQTVEAAFAMLLRVLSPV